MPKVSSRKKPKVPKFHPSKSKQDRTVEAYQRLGVTETEVRALPRITHILSTLPSSSGKAKGPGSGIERAVEFLRGAHEEEARKWLSAYDSIPVSSRSLIPFESYCAASGVGTKRILEVITGACFEQADLTARLLSKSAHPDLVQKSIKFAQRPKGWEDRKMIHQHEGFAPIPKTQVVNVQGNVNTDNRIQSIAVGEISGIESDMSRIADRFNEKMISNAEPELIPASVSVDSNTDPEPDTGPE